jgi:hypothetical protein
LSKGDEEELVPGVVNAREQVLATILLRDMILLFPCSVGLDDTGVTDVLARGPTNI